ncbi:MAG TPA: TonB-dependent receptor [Candidatus Dormibacteraeota bacterium]|nr:TonB-dependent receptor [Candidatus Dormibacteraeota bacterium]
MRYLSTLLLMVAVAARAAEIKGKVTNAVGGEALGRVEVVVLETKAVAITSISGEFDIPNVTPGNYTLRFNAVGYRLLTVPFTFAAESDIKEFSITMVPDNFHHTDRVKVHADVFQVADSPATIEMNLTSSEIRETSTVFGDDPFRAVQTLPGVSAEGNNEFFAEFSVMGTPFANVGVYVDDVLVLNPFHEIGNFSEGASLGVLTSEVVEEMKLLPAAYPEKYGDADGAALDIHTREGSRGSPLFRISAGIAASEILGEGGLGTLRKGSWLISARKSYINYLVHGRIGDAANVGFEDGDLKLTYDLTPRQNVNLFATGGHTAMAMNDPELLANVQYASGSSDFTLVRAGWRWALGPQLLVDARAAYIREPDQLFNSTSVLLTKTDHREWVGGAGVSWAWAPDQVLQAGWSERRVRDSEYQVGITSTGTLQPYSFSGAGLRQSGYAQQASTLLRGRVHVLGSLRWDRFQSYLPQRFSPQISLAVHVTHATEFQFGAGRYAQFSNSAFGPPPGECIGDGALPPTSEHYNAAVEQRLGENTRVRLEAFQRKDFSTFGAIPIADQSCSILQPLPGGTYLRDYSHGVQLILQRRSANRLSGWIGYTLLKAQERQYEIAVPYAPYHLFFNSGFYYSTLEDQRHSLNVFATYRLLPTLNLSGKYSYGSGFPIPSGTFVQLGSGQFVETGINNESLGPYQRLDVRADRDWAFQHWKLTLYGEVLNLTNHYNGRFAYESGIDPNTGKVLVKTLQGLPVTPTVGVVAQF